MVHYPTLLRARGPQVDKDAAEVIVHFGGQTAANLGQAGMVPPIVRGETWGFQGTTGVATAKTSQTRAEGSTVISKGTAAYGWTSPHPLQREQGVWCFQSLGKATSLSTGFDRILVA